MQIPPNLRQQLDAIDAPLTDPTPMRYAAVLAALMPEPGGDDRLLLIERSVSSRAHPGQLAFPGGKPEPGDRDLLDTALREAEEEVALPRQQVEVLGRLQPVPVPTGFLIVPYVGVIAGSWQPRCQVAEVKTILTPTLKTLIDPAHYRFAGTRAWQGVDYTLHEYRIHNPPLWGATARMVYDLLLRMGHAPPVTDV